MAAWVEHTLGLEDRDGKLARISRPLTVVEAAERLASDSGLEAELCGDYLLAAHRSRSGQGAAFFPVRLHQFISGAWNAYSTLQVPGDLYVTLDGLTP